MSLQADPAPFATRLAAALVLAPPVLAAIWFGRPFVELLILLSAGVTVWEWARLCSNGALGTSALVAIAAVVASALLGILGAFAVAYWLVAFGAMAALLLATRETPVEGRWLAFGVLYLSAAHLAFLWLRLIPDSGRDLVLWLLATVWATDSMAYLVGRSLGGPKLAPAISPKKTWSGLAGGVFAAIAVGFVAGALMDLNPWRIALAGAALAIVEQSGDLLESALKRRFGAKDASRLIPGHGGLLDRVDGLLAASLVAAAFVWLQL
ncbi:MAG: phosphatidate cytidylyltransferase [Kiloniellales bacterium]